MIQAFHKRTLGLSDLDLIFLNNHFEPVTYLFIYLQLICMIWNNSTSLAKQHEETKILIKDKRGQIV